MKTVFQSHSHVIWVPFSAELSIGHTDALFFEFVGPVVRTSVINGENRLCVVPTLSDAWTPCREYNTVSAHNAYGGTTDERDAYGGTQFIGGCVHPPMHLFPFARLDLGLRKNFTLLTGSAGMLGCCNNCLAHAAHTHILHLHRFATPIPSHPIFICLSSSHLIFMLSISAHLCSAFHFRYSHPVF